MAKPIDVEITARACELGPAMSMGGRVTVLGAPQPITVEIKLAPHADSHGEALVQALRQAADIAAARLGLVDLIDAAPDIKLSRDEV